MGNFTPNTSHLKTTQWQPGQSGNPHGKPKGTKHLSSWIQEMMEDETFKHKLNDGSLAVGAPVKAIIATLIIKAMNGDMKAFDLLGKYGYGSRINFMSKDEELPQPILDGLSMNSLTDNELDAEIKTRKNK